MQQLNLANVYRDGRKISEIELAQAPDWAARPGHFVWIDLLEPAPAQILELQQLFALHELAVNDALARNTRTKLETFGDSLFMVLYSPDATDGSLTFAETQLFAGKGYVICIRYADSPLPDDLHLRCEARPLLLANGEDFVIYALLNAVIGNYRPLLDDAHGELEEIEQALLERPLRHADVEQIHALRRDLLRLRRQVAPLTEICLELQQLNFPFIDKQVRPYFRDLGIHLKRVLEDIGNLREIANHAIEVGLLLESSRQSLTQRKFAAWAAILALPTAIAGVYGMNFRFMPELEWQYGYFAVLGLIGLGCGGLYLNFKRLRWL